MKRKMLLLTLAAMLFSMAGTNLSAGTNLDTLWTKFLYYHGTCLATKFSPDGSKVAVGTENGFIMIYETKSGELLNTFKHPNSASDILFSNDGNSLYSINHDTLIEWNVNEIDINNQINRKLWDTTTIENIMTQTFNGISLSDDGRYIYLNYQYRTFKQSAEDPDYFYNVWRIDTESFDIHYLLRNSLNRIYGVVPTPDGSKLIVGEHYLDEEIFIRDANTYELIQRLESPFLGIINDIAVSPDGKLVAAAGWDGSVRIWSLDSMKLVHKFFPSPSKPESLTFIDNEQLVVAYMYDIQTFSINSKSLLNSYYTASVIIKQPDFNFGLGKSIAYSNDKIALTSDGGLMLLNNPFTGIESPEEPYTLIYPNPANSTVTIVFEEVILFPVTITLNSLDGSIYQTVYSDLLPTNSFTLPVAEYPSGVYFINVQTQFSSKTYKIMKM